MSASQRRKGAAYELEVAKDFAALMRLPVPKRELSQTRDGGHDLRTGRWSLEAKRRKHLITLYGWLGQAISGVREGTSDVPAVVMRADNEETLILMRLRDLAPMLNGDEVAAFL